MRGSRLFVQSLLLAATASFFSHDNRLRAQQTVSSEQELLLGVWHLDLVKSRYTPGPPPRSETRTYVRDKEGVKGTIRRRRDDGREEVIEYRADGTFKDSLTGAAARETSGSYQIAGLIGDRGLKLDRPIGTRNQAKAFFEGDELIHSTDDPSVEGVFRRQQ